MAFKLSDLTAIDAAIASGELTVRMSDGRMITMRSIDELLKARALIVSGLESGQAGQRRAYPRHQLADFSD